MTQKQKEKLTLDILKQLQDGMLKMSSDHKQLADTYKHMIRRVEVLETVVGTLLPKESDSNMVI